MYSDRHLFIKQEELNEGNRYRAAFWDHVDKIMDSTDIKPGEIVSIPYLTLEIKDAPEKCFKVTRAWKAKL